MKRLFPVLSAGLFSTCAANAMSDRKTCNTSALHISLMPVRKHPAPAPLRKASAGAKYKCSICLHLRETDIWGTLPVFARQTAPRSIRRKR